MERLFFLILCVDALLSKGSFEHSDLRISKLPWFFEEGLGWVPSDAFVQGLYPWISLAALLAALLPRRRVFARTTAVLYTFVYLASAYNRYQHHWLIVLLLFIFTCVPAAEQYNFALVQVAIVYFWTAIAKLPHVDGGAFASGDFLRATTVSQVSVYEGVHFVAEVFGVEDAMVWKLTARGVIFTEFMLVFLLLTEVTQNVRFMRYGTLLSISASFYTNSSSFVDVLMLLLNAMTTEVLIRKLEKIPDVWLWWACTWGLGLHLIGFELIGKLSIGFFSYYMCAFYLSILPPFKRKLWPKENARPPPEGAATTTTHPTQKNQD